MYKIIGADHREYGPATADEIRMWIREGRANGQTLIQGEGTTEWKPLASFPELASALPTGFAGATPTPAPPLTAAQLLARDYDLDIFDCIRRGWNLVIANFWPVVGISLLVGLANAAVNQVVQLFIRPSLMTLPQHEFTAGEGILILIASMASAGIGTVFMGGLFRYLLKLVRGQPAELGDAFSGFSVGFVQLFLLGLVTLLLLCIGLVCCVLPFFYLMVAWSFSIPLLVDRNLPFWDAMELSRKVVTRHWFLLLGFIFVNALFAISGVIACCIGLVVTGPMAYSSLLYAYEDIFGTRNSGSV